MAKPFAMVVETGKIREMARATGSRHVEHQALQAAVSPPTFLMTATLWQGHESRPLPADRDMSRVLHAGQEFMFPHGPPVAGAQLVGQVVVEDTYTKQGRRGGAMDFTVLLTTYRDESGDVVAEVRQTWVETSRPASAGS